MQTRNRFFLSAYQTEPLDCVLWVTALVVDEPPIHDSRVIVNKPFFAGDFENTEAPYDLLQVRLMFEGFFDRPASKKRTDGAECLGTYFVFQGQVFCSKRLKRLTGAFGLRVINLEPEHVRCVIPEKTWIDS